MTNSPSESRPTPSAANLVKPATNTERREHRFRIAGDPAEAMKVVLAQLPDDEI